MSNCVPKSTESDGVTIYNNGLGYKDDYRVRSGGAETSNANSSITGYIPIKAGDIVEFSGITLEGAGTGNAINVFDASYANLGQAVQNVPDSGYYMFSTAGGYAAYGWHSVVEKASGVFQWVVPPATNIAYMRLTGFTKGDGSKLIVTVNEEIVL